MQKENLRNLHVICKEKQTFAAQTLSRNLCVLFGHFKEDCLLHIEGQISVFNLCQKLTSQDGPKYTDT